MLGTPPRGSRETGRPNWRNSGFRLPRTGYNSRMESSPTPTGPDVERLKVPEELIKQVHEARERFRLAKENMEKAMDDTDYDHGQHVDGHFAELRKAERELEELTDKVQEILNRKV
jgi:hypothetical protein